MSRAMDRDLEYLAGLEGSLDSLGVVASKKAKVRKAVDPDVKRFIRELSVIQAGIGDAIVYYKKEEMEDAEDSLIEVFNSFEKLMNNRQ